MSYHNIFKKIESCIALAKYEEALRLIPKFNEEVKRKINTVHARIVELNNQIFFNQIYGPDLLRAKTLIINDIYHITDSIKLEIELLDDLNVDTSNSVAFEILLKHKFNNIEWLERGIKASNSVCRVVTPLGYGTAFVIDDDIVMTNHHVVLNKDMAKKTTIEFGYNSENAPIQKFAIDHNKYISNQEMDFAFLGVETDVSLKEQFGVLPLTEVVPQSDELLLIIQHPYGKEKKLAFCHDKIYIKEKEIRYRVSTDPGSSGSPVFNKDWNVVALHSKGGIRENNYFNNLEFNSGYLMKDIMTFLS